MMFYCENCDRWTAAQHCPICGEETVTDKEIKELMPKKTENDVVNHPEHYTQGGIECIDAEKAALGDLFMGFLIGNALKYLWRFRHKNGLEDLKKAKWYLEKAIEEMSQDANM